MKIPDERFFAWLDGELPVEEAEEVEAQVVADPELSALAEKHRELRARLVRAFDSVEEAEVPPRLADAVRLKAPANDTGPQLRQWMSVAASLAAGLLIGAFLLPYTGGEQQAPLALERGGIVATGDLRQTLDKTLASSNDGPIRVGLTFRDHESKICRTFNDAASTGVACRSGDMWQVRGLFSSEQSANSEYRMASGLDPQLADLVISMMVEEPLDAAAERAARDSGWK